eukprot:10083907-Ditylum_brightwellii.AAC.2
MPLEDPKSVTMWQLVELPKEILHYLTICNRCHLGQASGNLFTVPPLYQHFDWAANSPISNHVLHDKYTNTEIDDITQLFLSHCKLGTNDCSIGEKIMCGAWIGKVRAWKESTTTLPSSRHLSHFKALVCCHFLDPNTEVG